MNKKAIAILGAIFILIVGTLGFLIISKYSSKSSADKDPITVAPGGSDTGNQQGNGTGTNPGTTPTSSSPKLTQDVVISPVLFYNGNGVTYFTMDGRLFQANFEKQNGLITLARARTLEIPQKSNIKKVLWPRQGDDFLVQFQGDSGLRFSYFNSKTGTYTDLPSQVYSVDWMPTGDKIIYTWVMDGKASLQTSDPDLKNWKNLGQMYQLNNNVGVSPDGLNVLFYRTDSAGATSSAISLTTPDGKIWKTLVKDGYNFGVLWSPDSKKFVFGRRDEAIQQLQLWHYDLLSNESKALGLYTTPDKAVWDSKSSYLYAALPSASSGDSIVRFDVIKSEKKQYDLPQGMTVSASNLFLSNDGNTLFFKNETDGALYYVNVGQ